MIDVKIVPDALSALVADGLTPGRIISHAWLDNALGIEKADANYALRRLARVQELRGRLLVEYKTDLKNIRGQGYMIVPPEEQTRLAMDDTIHGIGAAIGKGQARVMNVDIAKLSDAGKRENADALARLAGLGSMTKKQIEG